MQGGATYVVGMHGLRSNKILFVSGRYRNSIPGWFDLDQLFPTYSNSSAANALVGGHQRNTHVYEGSIRATEHCGWYQSENMKRMLGTLFDPCRLAYLAYTSND
jgi:hypothetical protein